MDRFTGAAKLSLQEPFSKMFEKATSLLRLSGSTPKAPALDGEIVYSKNNVCVHQAGSESPVPGYMSLRCSMTETPDSPTDSTLILHWVPNATIRSNPRSVDSPLGGSPRSSPSLVEAVEGGTAHSISTCKDLITKDRHCASPSGDTEKSLSSSDTDLAVRYIPSRASSSLTSKTSSSPNLEDFVVISSEEGSAPTADSCEDTEMKNPSTSEAHSSLTSKRSTIESNQSNKRPVTLTLSTTTISSRDICDGDNNSVSSGSTGGPDSDRSMSPGAMSELSSMCDIISLTETAESIAETHNLLFPLQTAAASRAVADSNVPVKPSVFSVNLGAMRSLRLLFSEDSASCGQLVIASQESQYKIFHFYNGGLDKLAEILQEWDLFHSAKQQKWRNRGISPFSQHFRIVKPHVDTEMSNHPEESLYQRLGTAQLVLFMNESGQIVDDLGLKKTVFFGGIDPGLRKEVWPFLLQYYPYDSTFEQREQIRNDKYLEYQKIRKKRERFSQNESWNARFWRSVQNIVEKDVIRTDRAHAYYKGEGNANVDVLKEILLNYAVAHPHLGYTQGMSDLLAPLLVELTNEVDAYWCFVGLMQRTIFNSQPKDQDMDRQLLYLKELLRLMFPKFYQHLVDVGEALGLLFVHRWILLCFKREFAEQDALTIWETCWANIQTDYFHLFIGLAIITSYSDDVLQENLPADEMLLHFSSLAHHMNGKHVIAKARALMHQFRLLEQIPCTVQDLCSMCSAGMWDSGHAPAVECVGHEGIDGCPYMGISPTRVAIGGPSILTEQS